MCCRDTTSTYRGLKMSNLIALTLITTAITFSSVIKPVHCADKTGDDGRFVCQKVFNDINHCDKGNCWTENIKMLKKCDPSYRGDQSIKQKCEDWPTEENQLQNQFLTLTVANADKGIAYWNMYCALCNFDDEFIFADPILLATSIERCGLSTFLNFNFAFDDQHIKAYANALCYGNASDMVPERVLKSDYGSCDETSRNSELPDRANSILSTFCDSDASKYCPNLSFRNDVMCSYGRDFGKVCQYDWFLLEGMNFAYGQNGDIHVPSYYKYKFPREQYSNLTGMKGVIYVCGEEFDRAYVPLKILIILLYSASMVFLTLCIILNSNKQSLQNLPNRTLYSFCITQLVYSFFRINNEFTIIDVSCIAVELVYIFVSLSSTLWNLVVFYEYSRLIYSLIRNLEPSAEAGMKIYLIYCSVCWILPAIPTVLALFFIALIGEKSPSCPEVENYRISYCGYDQRSHEYAGSLYEFNETLQLIATIIFTVGFFGVLAVVYLSRRGSIIIKDIDNMVIFKKNALVCSIVSFPFVFYLLEEISEHFAGQLFLDLFEVFDGLMGVLIFFACYYDENTLSKVRVMWDFGKTHSSDDVRIYVPEDDDISQISKE